MDSNVVNTLIIINLIALVYLIYRFDALESKSYYHWRPKNLQLLAKLKKELDVIKNNVIRINQKMSST